MADKGKGTKKKPVKKGASESPTVTSLFSGK
jgi:hypothetical protein